MTACRRTCYDHRQQLTSGSFPKNTSLPNANLHVTVKGCYGDMATETRRCALSAARAPAHPSPILPILYPAGEALRHETRLVNFAVHQSVDCRAISDRVQGKHSGCTEWTAEWILGSSSWQKWHQKGQLKDVCVLVEAPPKKVKLMRQKAVAPGYCCWCPVIIVLTFELLLRLELSELH